MDSMLDTLTNVVGILLIVLVTVQLSTQEAAERIAEAVEKIDPAEIARIEQQAAESKAAADRAQAELDAAEQKPVGDPAAEAARLEAQAATLEREARQAEAKATALEKEKAEKARAMQQAAADADRKAKEAAAAAAAAVKAAETARQALAIELEQTEKPLAPPAKEVRLPDPRPAPAGVKEFHVLCREGRIWLVDIPELQEKAQKRADFVVRSKKLDPDGDTWLADGKTFADEFNEAPVKDAGFEMTLEIVNNRWTRLVLTRMKGRGESAEEAVKPTGEFARTLRRLKPETHVLRFFVWPDSFEEYLQVRQLAGERGYLAGWEPMTAPDEYRIGLGRYAVGEKPPPKPADPNAKPPPPPNVLD
jgi:chemotaxis protein histidine kinase CheA